jgi:hypothetical protein
LKILRFPIAIGVLFLSVLSGACTRPQQQVIRVSAYTFVVCWRPLATPSLTSECGDQSAAKAAEKDCGGPAPAQRVPLESEGEFVESDQVARLKQCMAARGWAPKMGPMHVAERVSQ